MTGRIVVGAVGVTGIGVGIAEVLLNLEQTSPFGLAGWLVGVLVLDDGILMPLALGLGWLVRRVVPARARPLAQLGLVVLTGLAFVAVPFAVSPARGDQSGTLLTQPYLLNLAILATVVAAGVAVAVLVTGRAGRRDGRAVPVSPPHSG